MTDNYQRDGFLLVRQAIPPADLEPLRACIHRQVGIYANEMFNDGKSRTPSPTCPSASALPPSTAKTKSASAPGTSPLSAPSSTNSSIIPASSTPSNHSSAPTSASTATTTSAPKCPTAS